MPSAFAPEIVVVQSQGIARWLTLRLAQGNGVCANVRFPMPAEFTWELFRAVLPEARATAFDRDIFMWRLLRLVGDLEHQPGFEPVAAYVQGDDFKRYQLVVRLAETFQRYLEYRPDWIQRWEEGRDTHWQALLWSRFAAEAPGAHRGALQADFVRRVNAGVLAQAGLPERIFVFGALPMPPPLLDLYALLARHLDVYFFVPNPCREYWGDIASERAIARAALNAESSYVQTGNPLLASLGRRGREFIDLIQEFQTNEIEQWVEPGDDTLLHAVQGDILDLRAPGASAWPCNDDDRSVQIHSCHGPMREVEVLYDQLLALFERYPGLAPSDVVVMTPDIETYSPLIEAVFSTGEPAIPFTISDRSAEQESRTAAAFLALLELPGGRYEVDAVLGVLDNAGVQKRFGLAEDDMDTVHRWVREANIRWGIDAAHRVSLGLPATHEHTWRFGLDRLLLGYALPGAGERLFADILPYDDVEGSDAQCLGSLASFAEAVFELNGSLQSARPMHEWMQTFRTLLGQFFVPDPDRQWEVDAIRSGIDALDRAATEGGFVRPVPLEVARAALRDELQIRGRGFLSGGVTFCAMVPMRSLPFEVVCLIGMNDGMFPRMQRRCGFDLMVVDVRRGDPSPRDDDRYLFLESLLSARRCFYVSYCGQDPRDNAPRPPSVLVSELLDYIERGFVGGGSGADRVLMRHPLQPFSSRYFDGRSRLFSYSRTFCDAASHAGGAASVPAFVDGDLPPPDEAWRSVELEALIRFAAHPARYFLRERLRIKLEQAESEFEVREPFALDALDAYQLKQGLLARRDGRHADAFALARAAGALPHGTVGQVLFERHKRRVMAFEEKLAAVLPAEPREPLEVDLMLGAMRLTGSLTGLGEQGLVRHRLAKLKAKDRLHAWILHLTVNAVAPRDFGRVTRWIAEDAMLTIQPVEEASEHLADLLECYWLGLLRPLHFFPETSLKYVQQSAVTPQVRATWDGAGLQGDGGEGGDAYYRLAFRARDPLDQEFEHLSGIVYGPMLAAMTEEKF